jgi:ATP-binding cassette subfamily C protein
MNKRLLSLNSGSKKWMVLTVFMNWISIICNITITLFIGNMIDKLYNNDFRFNLMKQIIFLMVILIIKFVSNRMSARFSYYSSAKIKKSLRESIYKKLLELGVNYNDTISTSSIVQISVDGVEALEIYFGRYLPQLFYSLLAPITLFVVVSSISLKVAIILLLCVPLIPISIIVIMKIAKKILSNYWNIYTNLGDSFLENIQGITTLKVFNNDREKNIKINE